MKQIIAPIFKRNMEGLWDCVPALPIDCDTFSSEGIEWFTPNVEAGLFKGYDQSRGSAKPQADSVKTVRIKVGSETYWVAIADDESEQNIADACNACCDDGTPVLPTPTIPDPIVEDCICPDTDGNYTYLFPVPSLIAGQTVIAKTTANGVQQTTSPAETSATNLRTWLAGNLSAMGTWSVVVDGSGGSSIKLVSTTVSCASMAIEYVSHAYCFDVESLTLPTVITGVTHNAVPSVLPDVPVNTLAEVNAAVANYFADGTLSLVLDQIQYNGTGVPSVIKTADDGNVSFDAGVCVALGGSLSARKPTAKAKAVVHKPTKKAAPKKAAKKAAPKKAVKKAAKKK